MKIKNVHFLANANLKGNKRSNLIMGFMILLVISLTLISSYSIVITKAVNRYKDDTRARMIELSPCDNGVLTDDVIDSIMQIDHVESVSMLQGMRNQVCDILSIDDENGSEIEFPEHRNDNKNAYVWSLIGNEKKDVIAGKSLDESPTFSCVIPNLFYPFESDNIKKENLDYLDGESLLGTTITVKPFGGSLEALYNVNPEISPYTNEWLYLPALEYKLKVVGVCYAAPSTSGCFDSIYVSEETGRLIMEQAFEASDIDMTDDSSDVVKWWNTPGFRTHYLVVDDYDYLVDVCNELGKIGIYVAPTPELGIKEGTIIIAKIFSTASILLITASVILCVINLLQSTITNIASRKGEIGLLKALGYTNKHIFCCLYYEHLTLTIRGCSIGAAISLLVILITNFIFSHSTFMNRLYIVNLSYFFILLAISVLITFIVPLICQLLGLKRLSKIQPREAMNSK